MDHWRVEIGDKDKYLGIVEAEGEDEAVEAAAEKFRVPASAGADLTAAVFESTGAERAGAIAPGLSSEGATTPPIAKRLGAERARNQARQRERYCLEQALANAKDLPDEPYYAAVSKACVDAAYRA